MSLIDKITDYGWQQGFGCVLLDDDCRLHLWSPKWPLTDPHFIHSHSYYFESTVLIGEMVSPEYEVTVNPDGESRLILGNVTEDKLRNPTQCDVVLADTLHVKEGDTYLFGGPDRYHLTDASRLVMTHFEVMALPVGPVSGFILPDVKQELTPRPTKPELKAEVLRLLEEHNL